MLKDWSDHGRLDPRRVGAFGFSSGGFTVLAAAGGELDGTRIRPHCRDYPTHYDCQLTAARAAARRRLKFTGWVHDDADQGRGLGRPGPGLRLQGRDAEGPAPVPSSCGGPRTTRSCPIPFHATAVRASLPKAPTITSSPGARHFDFLTPCNDYTRKNLAFLCNSDPSFDRAAFHEDFNAKVVAFFEANLPPHP
jgi:predicted dienelactone hydrolase